MIEMLLPSSVCAIGSFDDPPEATLFPEEEQVIVRAVRKRRMEFTTVRWCARAALIRLGAAPMAIVPGERGAPQWPAGIVGSMTHCAGYRGAAVAWATDIATLGVDAEPNEPLPAGVLDTVTSEDERDWIGELGDSRPEVRWDRFVFSAKESVYKAWYPLTKRWLGFHEVRITVDPQTGTFRAKLLVPGPICAGRVVGGFSGRWLVSHGLVLTAIAVPTFRSNM